LSASLAATAVRRWRGAIDPATVARWHGFLGLEGDGTSRLAEAIDVDEVLLALAPQLRPLLGAEADLLVGQCWIRRARPPHSWHQDGALHATFAGGESLLPIVTCWLALTDCGVDAPGLEWVDPTPAELLAPAELADASVRRRHPQEAFVRGSFAAGDALVFGGALLHRTHATPSMTRPRLSVELRFVDRSLRSPRLAGELRRPAFR
jgi:hypothetical protein